MNSLSVMLRGVSVRREGRILLDQVNLDIPRGESYAIVGPNGAGKTTLINVILGSIPFEGKVLFENGRPRIGYVPQRFSFDRSMPMTVMELLAAGIDRWPLLLGVRKRTRDRAMELLRAVNAGELSSRRLGDLSGGELQRVLLAQALERDPDLLIMDEPGAGMDVSGDELFCDLLEELRRKHGFTQIMVSHNLNLVAAHTGRVALLNRRVVAEGLPCEVFSPENLLNAFGVHMTRLDACVERRCPTGKCCPDA